jgi:hypothetical protein
MATATNHSDKSNITSMRLHKRCGQYFYMNILRITLPFIILMYCYQPMAIKSQSNDNKLIISEVSHDTVKSIFSGTWINKKYVDRLLESKSPKTAQDVVPLTMLTFPNELNEKVNIIWGFHEGTIGILKKKMDFYFVQYNGTEKYDSLVFLETNLIKFKDNEFIKLSDSIDLRDPHLADQLLFAGRYNWNGKQVEFSKDGKVIGLDSISYYSVIIDYYDAGMEVDQIRLGNCFNNSELYGFKFSDDTLFIYQLNCLLKSEGFCYKVENGQIIYKLKME